MGSAPVPPPCRKKKFCFVRLQTSRCDDKKHGSSIDHDFRSDERLIDTLASSSHATQPRGSQNCVLRGKHHEYACESASLSSISDRVAVSSPSMNIRRAITNSRRAVPPAYIHARTMRVLCVAEKPSISKAVAGHLSGGGVQTVCLTTLRICRLD